MTDASPKDAESPEKLPEPWRKQLQMLRHDLRGILSPAMLISDRLLMHEDPAVRRAGEIVARTVERAAERLSEDRN